jgi:hypothetical protein
MGRLRYPALLTVVLTASSAVVAEERTPVTVTGPGAGEGGSYELRRVTVEGDEYEFIDVNLDGRKDVVVVLDSGAVRVYLLTSANIFPDEPDHQCLLPEAARAVAIANLVGDASLEVAYLTPEGLGILQWDEPASATPVLSIRASNFTRLEERESPGIQLVHLVQDIDNDGWADVMMPEEGLVTFYRNAGNGSFERKQAIPVQRQDSQSMWSGDLEWVYLFRHFALALEDRNQDELVDLVYTESNLEWELVYQQVAPVLFAYPPERVRTCGGMDVDGDGQFDQVEGDLRSGWWSPDSEYTPWFNKPRDLVHPAAELRINYRGSAMRKEKLVTRDLGPSFSLRDLDQDGDLDAICGFLPYHTSDRDAWMRSLVRHEFPYEVHVYINDRGFQTTPASRLGICFNAHDMSWRELLSGRYAGRIIPGGDWDGDGCSDLAVRPDDGHLVFYRFDPERNAFEPFGGQEGLERLMLVSPGMDDVNGDGRDDLFAPRNEDDGTIDLEILLSRTP